MFKVTVTKPDGTTNSLEGHNYWIDTEFEKAVEVEVLCGMSEFLDYDPEKDKLDVITL